MSESNIELKVSDCICMIDYCHSIHEIIYFNVLKTLKVFFLKEAGFQCSKLNKNTKQKTFQLNFIKITFSHAKYCQL